jgi:hypothetical protein
MFAHAEGLSEADPSGCALVSMRCHTSDVEGSRSLAYSDVAMVVFIAIAAFA